jgi:hypothetical protein
VRNGSTIVGSGPIDGSGRLGRGVGVGEGRIVGVGVGVGVGIGVGVGVGVGAGFGATWIVTVATFDHVVPSQAR